MKFCALLLALAFIACHPSGARRSEDIYRQARAAIRLGDCERAAGLITQGVDSAPAQWIPAFRVLRAECLVVRGNYEEALDLLQQTPIPDSSRELAARRSVALAQCQCSMPGKDEHFRKGEENLRLAQEVLAGSADPEMNGEIEIVRARCRIRQNKLVEAEESCQHVLTDSERDHVPLMRAAALNCLAYLRNRDGRFDDAADYARTALELAQQEGSSFLTVKNLGNLGSSYIRIGDYDSALPLLERGEKIARQQGYRDDLQPILGNIGNLYYFRRDYAAAAGFYAKALQLARDLKLTRPMGQMLANLGDLAVLQGRFDEAETYNQEALVLKMAQRDRTAVLHSRFTEAAIAGGRGEFARAQSIYREVSSSRDSNDILRWTSHANLAELYAKRSMKGKAESEFRQAIRVMERSRDDLKFDTSKMLFLSSLVDFYTNYVAFEVETNHPERALEIADRSRAQLLREKIGGGATVIPSASAPALRRKARSIPAIFLTYWLAPVHSYLWVVTAGRIALFTLPPEQEIQRLVDEHQRMILRPRDLLHEDEGRASALYRTLIGPAAELIPREATVIVVPDGALNRLSFETLVVDEPTRHYWIEDVILSIAPSLGILSTGRNEISRRLQTALLVGDPVPPGSGDFPKLPNAAREIERVGHLFPEGSRTIITGARATPAVYREAHPEKFTLIHFAAHATANREDPLDSAVILSQGRQGFRLYAREVLKTPLDTGLVTISACRSAGARSFAGEGLVGLAWAFLSAGAHNVIAGLWNVEDASTAQMMEQIYREMRDGSTPAVALRSAKLALIHSQTAYRKPFYWAPFVLFTRNVAPITSERTRASGN